MADLEALRRSYRRGELVEVDAPDDPWTLFDRWFADVQQAGLPEPNAMTLATVDVHGRPHARTVLLKGLVEAEGAPGGAGGAGGAQRTPQFFSNADSDKGQQLAANPACALLFTWLPLERQVRIEGAARRLDAAREDGYFASRPRGSQIGAWASAQSSVVEDRSQLQQRFAEAEQRFDGAAVPRPPHWGGWGVEVDAVEFWQGRDNRLHDRLRYVRDGAAWRRERLAP